MNAPLHCIQAFHDPSQNRVLAGIDIPEFLRLSPHLELVLLSQGEVLHHPGTRLSHVYFPTTATVSIDHVLRDGATFQVASVGSEGLFGTTLFMGDSAASGRAVVQIGGHAYRLTAARLLDEFYRKGPLLRLLLRYTQTLMTQFSQGAICNCHHTTQQRLCRWLLQTLDRSGASELAVTHEAISALLGVRREGITEAAGRLQERGVIRCRRGQVTVLDRPALERLACECYEVLSRDSAQLSRDTGVSLRSGDRCGFECTAGPRRRVGMADRRNDTGSRTDAVFDDAQFSFQFL